MRNIEHLVVFFVISPVQLNTCAPAVCPHRRVFFGHADCQFFYLGHLAEYASAYPSSTCSMSFEGTAISSFTILWMSA